MEKQEFSSETFDQFIDFLTTKYKCRIHHSTLVKEFDNYFTEDYFFCGERYCYINVETDERMLKKEWTLNEDTLKYSNRHYKRPRQKIKTLKGQTQLELKFGSDSIKRPERN